LLQNGKQTSHSPAIDGEELVISKTATDVTNNRLIIVTGIVQRSRDVITRLYTRCFLSNRRSLNSKQGAKFNRDNISRNKEYWKHKQ